MTTTQDFSFKSKLSINSLWLISSALLTLVSLFTYKGNPKGENSLGYFIFYIGFCLALYFLNNFNKIKKSELKLFPFLLGTFVILFSEPIFENDHYRYLWEGRALFSGENPYTEAPNSKSLDHLEFTARDKIGFNYLTTVYPPLALTWFGLGGILSAHYRVGLIFLMLLNALLIFFILKKLEGIHEDFWLLILLFPYLQKEFIQSIHIDLLAFFPVFFFLISPGQKMLKAGSFILLSIFTKILGLFFVYPFVLSHWKKSHKDPRLWLMVMVILISFPLFYFYLLKIDGTSGFKAFTQGWVWNPGFYSLLWRGIGLEEDVARKWTQFSFLFYLVLIGVGSLKFFIKQKLELSKIQIGLVTYLFFSGLIFFTPVYNAWYAIWFLIPAFMINLPMGMAYGLASVTCYGAYLNKDWLFAFEFLGHLFFPISLYQIYKNREKWRLNNH